MVQQSIFTIREVLDEDWACQRSLPRIALNVAAHNDARMLYEDIGYRTEVLRMSKEIG